MPTQVFADDADGRILRTNATEIQTAIRASSSSMAASIRPTLPTSRTCWPKRTPPCAPSWSAATSLLMAACSLAMASSRDCPPPPTRVAAARVATPRRATVPTAAAGGPATTPVAAPPPHSTETGIVETFAARHGAKASAVSVFLASSLPTLAGPGCGRFDADSGVFFHRLHTHSLTTYANAVPHIHVQESG